MSVASNGHPDADKALDWDDKRIPEEIFLQPSVIPVRNIPKPMESCRREATLIVHYETFGNEEQLYEGASRLLRVLEVKGVGVLHATINDKPVEPAPAS